MLLFEKKPQFDPNTGKPVKTKLVRVGWVCDFCGKSHKTPEEEVGLVQYSVHESGDIEPQFHDLCIEGYKDIDRYDIFNNHDHFVYCQDWDMNSLCEQKMISAAMKLRKKGTQLCHIMYEARINMLKKVLDKKQYTIEEFGL
jgi:quinol monooxygenase YgiN